MSCAGAQERSSDGGGLKPNRKALQGVAHNEAESFCSLMNYFDHDYVMGHIVFAAWETGGTGFRVNLLTGVRTESPLLVAAVRQSVDAYVKEFPSLVNRSMSSIEFVREAEMIVTVDPSRRRPHGGGTVSRFQESPFTCSVRLTDDRGRVYAHEVAGWWYPERPAPEDRVRSG